MKKAALVLVAFLVAVSLGCNQKTPGGGTHSSEDKKSKLNEVLRRPNKGEFDLKAPNEVLGTGVKATTIKQGETQKHDIGITRGEGFDQDVQLSFENLPQGVTVQPGNLVLKHGDDKVTVSLKAAENAALTEATVKIVGKTAKSDKPASTDWKIKVEKK